MYQLEASIDDALNRNEYGSLEIDNHKGLVMQLHQHLLAQTMKAVNESNNKELLWRFVHGIFEGDGYVDGGLIDLVWEFLVKKIIINLYKAFLTS